jgi:hypothetical protein
LSYYEDPRGTAEREIGRRIYMDALSGRREFRDDQLGIFDVDIWEEIFEHIGEIAITAVAQGGTATDVDVGLPDTVDLHETTPVPQSMPDTSPEWEDIPDDLSPEDLDFRQNGIWNKIYFDNGMILSLASAALSMVDGGRFEVKEFCAIYGGCLKLRVTDAGQESIISAVIRRRGPGVMGIASFLLEDHSEILLGGIEQHGRRANLLAAITSETSLKHAIMSGREFPHLKDEDDRMRVFKSARERYPYYSLEGQIGFYADPDERPGD